MNFVIDDDKCRDANDIKFLIASSESFACMEAAGVQPESHDAAAHDAFTRPLTRLELGPEALCAEARPRVHRQVDVLVPDDTTLAKPYEALTRRGRAPCIEGARPRLVRASTLGTMDPVTRHWSGKHHAVVRGINLTTPPWTDRDRYVPCDYRRYDEDNDGPTKNDHFLALLWAATCVASPPTASASTVGTAAWKIWS
jgi:hypothetical protein